MRAAIDHGAQQAGIASAWVQQWSHLVPAGATVLDVACGSGRHVRWFAQRGCRVTGIDRDAEAMKALGDIAELVVADIETGPWPWEARRFDAVVVTNYLWRERLPNVIDSVGAGGILIYETYAAGNETVGKPSNPKFLLRPNELLEATRSLRVLAFEDGFEDGSATSPRAESARFVQRIVAVREAPRNGAPTRYPLRPRARQEQGSESGAAGQVKSSDSEDPP